MFTGLIEEIGTVKDVKQAGEGILLTVTASKVVEDAAIGDSIAIDGACQTVTDKTSDSFTTFVSRVTADVTILGSFIKGRKVNLERAITPTSRLGGHIVQGHVDGTGKIISIKKDTE